MDHSRATTGPRPHAAVLAVLCVVAFVACAACFLFFELGYSFESGDQLQYLLLPYRAIYPHFVPGDWVTWQTVHYHQTYSWLIRALHALAGESAFATGVLLAQLCVLGWLGYAVLQLSLALGFGVFEAAFALLVFGGVREAGMAGALFNHGQLLPADLALPAFLLACAAWARGQPLRAGIWLGVSGFWHANFVVLGPLVLGPLGLAETLRQRSPRPLLSLALPVLVLAAPTLWLLVGSFLVHDDAPSAIAITLFTRSPHHYDLWAMHAEDFYWPALVATLGLPVWLEDRRTHPERLQLLLSLCAVIALGVLGSGLHLVTLARVFAFRMSVPLLVLLLLTAAHALRRLVAAGAHDPVFVLWACTSVAALLCFGRVDLARTAVWGFGGAYCALAAVLPLLAAALLARAEALAWRPLCVGLLTLTLLWAGSLAHARMLRARPGEPWSSAQGLRSFHAPIALGRPDGPLYAAIRARAPSDARILAPPGLLELRLLGRRAVFVDWKCAPMKGDEAREWQRRMLASIGQSQFPATGYALRAQSDRLYWRRPLSELAALARREGMTHVLAPARAPGERAAGLRKVLVSAPYALYELQPQPPHAAAADRGL